MESALELACVRDRARGAAGRSLLSAHSRARLALRRSAAGGEVALRNEAENRRRLAAAARPGAGAPLRVTDPAALARLLADMRAQDSAQRAAVAEREAERARREGAAYVPPEERAAAAAAAAATAAAEEGGAAAAAAPRLDPGADYYAALELDRAASSAEVLAAYKRLALLYHPDKVRPSTSKDGGGAEAAAAVAARFREVAAAFEVLSDEGRRALYDKVRDHRAAHPGNGLPLLSREEAAALAAGAGELRRLRRAGPKAGVAPPLERPLALPLAELDAGCAAAATVKRSRVDYSGKAFTHSFTAHLVVRAGSRPGDRVALAREGDEAVSSAASLVGQSMQKTSWEPTNRPTNQPTNQPTTDHQPLITNHCLK
jgi:hypothetical protein